MISWLFQPRAIDPDNPWARRLLRVGPGGATKGGRKEPWFRATAGLVWLATFCCFPASPAILSLVHAPFSGYRRRRRLISDEMIPELLLLPGDYEAPAAALRAAVERWSRRMAILACAVALLGLWWFASMAYHASRRPFRTGFEASMFATMMAWWAAACVAWWAGCHFRATMIAAWPRLWLAKGIGLAWAAAFRFGVLYLGSFFLMISLAWNYHGFARSEELWTAGVFAGLAIAEAIGAYRRLYWAERAWRGAAASIGKELQEIAAKTHGRREEES